MIATTEQALQIENAEKKNVYFKLVADVVTTDEIYFSGTKLTFDLNGHSIKLEYGAGVKLNNGGVFNVGGSGSTLVIKDSSEKQTGSVIGCNKNYSEKVTCAVRINYKGRLEIYGGKFYGTSEGTSCIFTAGRSASVKIYGGEFSCASASNGKYYVLNHQDGKAGASYNNKTGGSTMTIYGGTFYNYNPGVSVVDPVNSGTGTIKVAEGYVTTEVAYDGGTKYVVSKAE